MKIKNKKIIIVLIIILILIIIFTVIKLKNGKNNSGNDLIEDSEFESSIKDEYALYQKELNDNLKKLEKDGIDIYYVSADDNDLIYKDKKIENMSKYDLIPSLKNCKYKDIINVANGKLDVLALPSDVYNIVSKNITVSQFNYFYCTTEYREKNNTNLNDGTVENRETKIDKNLNKVNE